MEDDKIKTLHNPRLQTGERLAALAGIRLVSGDEEFREHVDIVAYGYLAYNDSKKKIYMRAGMVASAKNKEALDKLGKNAIGHAVEFHEFPFDMSNQMLVMAVFQNIMQHMQMHLEHVIHDFCADEKINMKPLVSKENPTTVFGFGGDAIETSDILSTLRNNVRVSAKNREINELLIKTLGIEGSGVNAPSHDEVLSSVEKIAEAMPTVSDHTGPVAKEETTHETLARLAKEKNALMKKIIDTKDVEGYKAIKGTLTKAEDTLLKKKLGIA